MIQVKKAAADADTMIVHTAIELSHHKIMMFVGTDIDLLILLIHRSSPDNFLYFVKLGSGTIHNKVYGIRDVQYRFPVGFCQNQGFFLHAMTGCYTTSVFFQKREEEIFQSTTEAFRSKKSYFDLFIYTFVCVY